MASLLITNGLVVTMNEHRDVEVLDIFIQDDRIVEMSQNCCQDADQVIDARGQLVIPGLIQSHVHLCQTLFRGMADDMELMDWLQQRIWPLEGAHDQDSLYYSALLGCAELIRGGTTAIIDMGTVHHTGALFQAVELAGMRYLGGKCLMDYGSGVPPTLMDDTHLALQESMDLYQRWNGVGEGRLRYCMCPRFAVSCSHDLLTDLKQIADQYSIPVHTHASENYGEIALVKRDRGLENIIYLHRMGFCGKNLILAHCIHITAEEMAILADTRTNIVHCPGSNLKLASGIAPVPELLQMEARVSLGADGAPCNNNLSMFNEMRLAALIHKPRCGPLAMSAPQVFEIATLGGAKALGLEDEVGSLEVGKKADLAIVSTDQWHTWPPEAASVYARLVYQAFMTDVTATVVDGRVLMQDGRMMHLPEADIRQQTRQALTRVLRRAGLA